MTPPTRRFGILKRTSSGALGTKAKTAPVAMDPAIDPAPGALAAVSPPGARAKAARRSPPSAARRAGRSLGPFRSTAWIATLASSGQGWRSSKRWVASAATRPFCRECDSTGWMLYHSETIDGELEEAYRLCPNRCAPRRCIGFEAGQPCSRPGTVRYGFGYYCKEHIGAIDV